MSSSNKIGTSDRFINDAYALADEWDGEDMTKTSHFFQSFQRLKISIFAVCKYENDLSKESLQKNIFWLDYKKTVLNLTLHDSLNTMGMRGSIIIHNLGSFADLILQRPNAFHIVVNFTIIDSESSTTKLEPYIFDISSVENLSAANVEDKKLKLNLVDIMTSVCMNHNIATLVKLTEGTITKRGSYKEVFEDILNYIKEHINVNMLKKYSFRKDLYFTDLMVLDGTIDEDADTSETEAYQAENYDMSELIKSSFQRMPEDATILDAIHILQQDCGRILKTPSSFTLNNQSIGDLIIPFFFKEEYQYMVPHYTMLWKEPDNTSTSNSAEMMNALFELKGEDAIQNAKNMMDTLASIKLTHNEMYGGKETRLLYRNMTMRDIYMPFFLAFIDKRTRTKESTENYIFESLNPLKNEKGEMTEEELYFKTVPGYRHDVVIHEIQSFPYNSEVVKKRWKNIVFVDNANGTSSVLIFLRWFYEYFCSVFLNNGGTNETQYLPNILPSFLAKSFKYENVAEADAEGETSQSLFDIHNSNIFVCKTEDSLNEAMREMGKNIASFILSNNRFVLKLDGDLFRRPNEIIKFTQFTSAESIFSSLNPMMSNGVNISGDPCTLMYVTDVTHVFEEDGYYNYVEGCKFCENYDYSNSNSSNAT